MARKKNLNMISTFVDAIGNQPNVEYKDRGVLTGQPQTSGCLINAKPVALPVAK